MLMKQIKTVICPLYKANEFDNEINSLLVNGWAITYRTITNELSDINEAFNISTMKMLYAELERHIPPFPEEITV